MPSKLFAEGDCSLQLELYEINIVFSDFDAETYMLVVSDFSS